jgi:hypothetical protein
MSVSIVPTLKVLKPAAMVVGVAFFGLVFGYWANAAFTSGNAPSFSPGYAPEQPIDFSHRIHAGENQIECLYCHTQASRSASAGVPSVDKCAGCHQQIATDRPQIRRVLEYWENQEPIPWIKVHDLPDFVYFPHKRHVAAGVACQTCHGPVETMDVVSRQAPSQMGVCLNCHKEHQVEFGTDCLTCHK